MKKEITIAAILFLFTASPVLADSSHLHAENSQNVDANHRDFFNTSNIAKVIAQHFDNAEDNSINPSITQTITPSIEMNLCDPLKNWKNHGAYVSCVAHLHHFMKNHVDDAARSDIGKDHPSCTPTPPVSVTVTPTPTISPSPTAAPTEISTPTPSVSPEVSNSPTPTEIPTATSSPTPTNSVTNTGDGENIPSPNYDAFITKIVSFLIHIF